MWNLCAFCNTHDFLSLIRVSKERGCFNNPSKRFTNSFGVLARSFCQSRRSTRSKEISNHTNSNSTKPIASGNESFTSRKQRGSEWNVPKFESLSLEIVLSVPRGVPIMWTCWEDTTVRMKPTMTHEKSPARLSSVPRRKWLWGRCRAKLIIRFYC